MAPTEGRAVMPERWWGCRRGIAFCGLQETGELIITLIKPMTTTMTITMTMMFILHLRPPHSN